MSGPSHNPVADKSRCGQQVGNNETWLILSHAYNMDGRAASHTITDKIPFLRRAGITPIVISARTGHKDTEVEHHQLLPIAPSGLKFDLRHVLRKRFTHPLGHRLIKGLIMLGLLPFYAVERALIHLESQWSWFWPAYRKGLKLIKDGKITAIYSTGGANSAHYAGYLLARKTGLPWIAEIHDPMIHAQWGSSRMAYRWAARLEGHICRHATLVWWFTQPALDRARARHPELGERGRLILPGCESPDFADAVYQAGDTLEIGHFGSLSSTRNFGVLFQALAELRDEGYPLAKKVRVNVYGTGLDAVSAQALEQCELQDQVYCHGRLERDEQTGKSGRQRVVEAMRKSDVLLLLHGNDPFCEEYIPSKLYEYLWTQRPILALTWRNPTLDQILQQSGHTAVVSNSVSAVKQALKALLQRWNTEGLADNGIVSEYTTENAVQSILKHFAELRSTSSLELTAEASHFI